MKFKSKFFSYVVSLFFLLCLFPVAFFCYKHPAYNFDMLGYMALVVGIDQTTDVNEMHSISYSQAKQLVPAEEYKKLTAPGFREKFATDSSRFKKILPIYAVKPLYIWLCWLFYKCGFSLPEATVMPSIVAFLAIGMLLFFWLKKYFKVPIAFLGALLIMFSLFTVAIAQLSTPDCLSAFFLFVSTYFILEKQNTSLMFIFFLLAIYTRVDNIFTCFFVISFLTFIEKWKRISKTRYFLMVLILAIAYISIVLPVTKYGWSLSFYSQYARQIDFSRNFEQSISFSDYLHMVQSRLVTALVSSHFTFFLFLGLLIIGNTGLSFRKLSFDQAFLLVLLLVVIFRFILLPDLSDRFYFGFYLVIIILTVRKYNPYINSLPA